MSIHSRGVALRPFLTALWAALGASGGAAWATGVPIDGFLPMVGISLTREFVDDFSFAPVPSTTMSEPQLGAGGVAHYDVALLDTGAAVSIINATSRPLFGIDEEFEGRAGDDGFAGSNSITIGGATGFVEGEILDPLGLYASGLQSPPRTSSSGSLAINSAGMAGQTNSSMVAVPPESDLPNVLGLPYVSQYATRIRSDQPQLFSLNGQTVRTPSIEFLPRGSGGMGITRKAPLSLNGDSPVTPQHIPTLDPDLILDTPWEDPFAPTVVFGGLFLNVAVEDNASGGGGVLADHQFFFDTGASVTVVSEFNAFKLGFDVTTDEPEFTLAIVGSGGTKLDVPGFFVDKFTLPALGGSIVATNVPVIVLDIADPSDPDNVIDGFVGTNLLAGRNLVIDPNPATAGGPSAGLYISDPVTANVQWSATGASAIWNNGSSWTGGVAPTVLSIANVRHTGSSSAQIAAVTADSAAFELNVSGAAADRTMTISIPSGVKLTTFAGLNIEQHGGVALFGGMIDVQYVDIRGGRLSGSGSIATGSGPIPGQVENVSGIVSPGLGVGTLNIEGRFSNGKDGTVEIEILGSGTTQYDRIAVEGPATLAGALRVLMPGASPYVPALGERFTILTTTDDITGQFAATELPLLPAGRMWALAYGALDLALVVTLPGDFDGSGAVDAADLALWKTGHGVKYNGNDFLAWQRNLGRSLSALASVPEPGGAVIALGASLGTVFVRRRRRSLD